MRTVQRERLDRPRRRGERRGAEEGPGHHPGKLVMIEARPVEPVMEEVVRRLEVEALLHFGVRGEQDVRGGDGQDQQVRTDVTQPPPHRWKGARPED